MFLNTPITNCNGGFSRQTGPNGSIIRDPFTGNIVPQIPVGPGGEDEGEAYAGCSKSAKL